MASTSPPSAERHKTKQKNIWEEPLYLDARQWLIQYAGTHADLSPISLEALLPAGRKEFYHCQYVHERESEKRPHAAINCFRCAWRVELPWLMVAKSICKFVKCGLCEYLKFQINITSRGEAWLIIMMRSRLGIHFTFQSAQRVALTNLEEACAQSNGKKWYTSIDKMDMHAVNFPTLWGQLASPLFKQGTRILAAINGSSWHGPRETQWHIRTMFEDIEHGSDMQMSTLTMNFVEAVARDGNMPEELVINTDNTPKETKNNIAVWWMIWLLCLSLVNGLPLWSMLLVNLIVGHTHGRVDRFFSRLRVALNGHDYFTMEQFIEIVTKALRGFNIRFSHLSCAWAWKEGLATLQLPEFVGMRRAHCLNVFRERGAIWVKWKQYMTSDSWSRPLCIVRPSLVQRIASFRPAQRQQAFKPTHTAHLLSWLDKFAASLADSHNSIEKHRGDIDWIRSVILGRRKEYLLRLSIDDLLAGVAGVQRQSTEVVCRAEEMPADMLVQLFPGADVPAMPADSLIHVSGVSLAPRADILGPGSLLICLPARPMIAYGQELPFCVAMHVVIGEDDALDDDSFLVQWLVPGSARQVVSGVGGRKKEVVDIFGPWQLNGSLAADEAHNYSLPPVLVHRDQVLMINIELDADERVPFHVFDELCAKHGVDCTAISISKTHLGGIYRAYVLMRLNRK